MKVLVTGSSGHLGEALVRELRRAGDAVVGLDARASPHTSLVGSILDPELCRRAVDGVEAVLHAATLHKPHLATHSRRAFVDVNVAGTLTLLEASAAAGVGAFVYTSTTSAFGDALRPALPGAPAVWVDETLADVPKNVYGATKAAAEDLCRLFARNHGLSSVVLRTSRFFPEDDDDPERRAAFGADALKRSELAREVGAKGYHDEAFDDGPYPVEPAGA